eukprot:CAMPEP_0183744746 /NCGR_PEP_ID=MMETSP0737-20130205/65886_1 /TAXON_ID=385413 /ORGANISM="Thalassiosira miniscula, Strain CCMP1093" /LENGTH=330 /DNA_ID=CAMNT_0025980397 /DNA_START=178 /DNA_END=1170 /DNA_ORIENTATION=+
MESRWKRILVVAILFIVSVLYYQTRHLVDILMKSLDQLNTIHTPRLEYIRPAGNPEELLAIFAELTEKHQSSKRWKGPEQQLPQSPQQIAEKYGIPQTQRDVECNINGTTQIGWIPNAMGDVLHMSHQGRIPRLIFQSWKTNRLKPEVCHNILRWSNMNPEYDYFLFDNKAIDNFIRLEYGPEIFSSYACVEVGAAKCDVWRLFVIYLFGGVYFDADVRLWTPLHDWDWGDRDVVTARSCTGAPRKYPGGCAHQWGMIYEPYHRVIHDAIAETLTNLANRQANNVYDVSFWSYYHAWRNGPYNQSYMPGWGEEMGGRVSFQDNTVKQSGE